jgi:hypothetical protein
VYALCIKDNKVLALSRRIRRGFIFLNYPAADWNMGKHFRMPEERVQEELNLEIEIKDHFYTQEFSGFQIPDNEQLITIYYLAEILNEEDLLILDPCIEKTEWIPLKVKIPFHYQLINAFST